MPLINCTECDKQISDRAAACPNCGVPLRSIPSTSAVVAGVHKSRSLAVLLAMLGGGIGLHKFYLNKPGEGVIYLLFCWTFIPAICGLFEGLNYLSMSDQAFQKKYSGGLVSVYATSSVYQAEQPKKPSVIVEWFGWFMFFAFLNAFLISFSLKVLQVDAAIGIAPFVAIVLTLFIRHLYKKKIPVRQ